MYLLYITRIYRTYNASKRYSYSKWFIGFLYILILSDYILKIFVYIILADIVSGDIGDKGEVTKFIQGSFIFLLIEELIVMLLIIIVFIKPLISMSRDNKRLSSDILSVITKYTILGFIAIISSFILSIFRLTYVGTFNLMVIWMTAIWVSVDCLINSISIMLVFSFAKPTYLCIFGCCDRKLRIFVERTI